MRILHVAAPDVAGGLERVVEALAVGHHERGHEVGVLALLLGGHDSDPLIPRLRSRSVRVFEGYVGSRAYLRERAIVRDVCQSFEPDVMHTHGYRTDVVDRSVASQLGIPTVTTVHGASMNGGVKGALYEWIQRLNYRQFDAVVAVSEALHEASLKDGVARDRLHLIPNAWANLHPPLSRVEARERLGLDPDANVVGWVGRMLHVKGGDLFLEAIRRLPRPRPTVAMIGQGEEEEALRRQAERLDLQDTVRFYAGITDAGLLFSAFDVYVLSSRSEGLPIVLLEAMAGRAPVVATRVGGVPEVVGNGEALLVPPEDADALAAAIRETLSDREAAQKRADGAFRRLDEKFAIDPWLDRYEMVYSKVAR